METQLRERRGSTGLWCPASTPTPLALIWISRLRSDCTKIGASRSFLGGNLLRTLLGNDYVERLFAAYAGRVPAEADLVIDWIFFTSSKAS